ncbi:hypothetical protein KI688_003926 [Linnemannia hyalina]|uniref:Uncharacterized protein n=1 Tax=Linnemannia hyalina TaxID=64524 RepID=A0A9P7XN38_9FUNG|nr:hypothetical protein KI688_003926 [Linnemannia hyalina]
MVSITSNTHRSPLLLLCILLLVACLFISVVHGQNDDSGSGSDLDPSLEEPEQNPSSPSTLPSPTPDQPPAAIPPPPPSTPPSTPATPPTTAPGTPAPASSGTPGAPAQPPNPIFSTSDACVACQKEFPTIRSCTALIPPPTVNLTVITQVLPFYNCLCNNGNLGSEIEALQDCSNCFRSTGQKAFLRGDFYNVTNQNVKAMKQVCEETVGGTRVPTSSSGTGAGVGLRDLGWCFVLAFVSSVFLVPGGP